MGILLLLALAQDLEGLLRELRDERAEVRDRASAALAEGWERWSDPDLARLEELRKGSDLEPAGRAADALATIRLRRSLGKDLLKRFPDLERIARRGNAVERREVLLTLRRSWRLADVDSDPLRALAETVVANGFELEEKDDLLEDLIPPFRPLLRPWLRRPELRWQAIDRIGDLDAKEYIPELKQLLADPDRRVRFEAADTLADWGVLDGRAVIAEAFGGEEPVLLRRAAAALGALGAREHAPRLLALLDARHPIEVRRTAAWALAELGVPEAEAPIAALLDAEDGDTRTTAARALVRLGAKGRAPAILARLPEAGGSESWALKEALLEMGLEPLRPRIESLLVDPDGRTRAQAWDLMAHLDGTYPLRLLDHENAEAREFAVWALVDRHDPSDAERFAGLLKDPEPDVRAAALEGLAGSGGAKHAPAIAACLTDRDADVRRSAVEALVRLQARDYAPQVAERLRDVDDSVIAMAIEALGDLGARESAGHLAAIVESPSDRARHALKAFGLLGMKSPALEAALKHENLDFRVNAFEALLRLDRIRVADAAAFLEEGDQLTVHSAMRALAWIGSDEAMARIRATPEDDDRSVQRALLESGRADALPEALEAFASATPHLRRFAAENLARWTARGLPVPDRAKLATILDRLDETEGFSARAATAACRVGLGLRPPRTLLPELDRLDGDVRVLVLCRAFAPEATANLHRPFVPKADIASNTDLSAALAAAWGLKVEVDPNHYFPGIHPAGVRTSGMRLIEALNRRFVIRASYLPTTGLVVEGDVVRVVTESDARAFWRKRLEATK